jgi:hypothetical protein
VGCLRRHWGENTAEGVDSSPYVGLTRTPVADAYPHYSTAAPGYTCKKRFARCSYLCDHLVCLAVMVLVGCARSQIQESNHPLVDRGFSEDLGSRQTSDETYKGRRVSTASFDQIGHTFSPKLTHSRISGKSARTPRPLGIPVNLIARLFVMSQVRSSMRHSSAMSFWVGNK